MKDIIAGLLITSPIWIFILLLCMNANNSKDIIKNTCYYKVVDKTINRDMQYIVYIKRYSCNGELINTNYDTSFLLVTEYKYNMLKVGFNYK